MVYQLCQIELLVNDLEAAKNFYQEVLEWRVAPAFLHNYAILDLPKDLPFGISLKALTKKKPYKLSQTILHFEATQIQREGISQRCEKAGGRIIEVQQKVPGYGTKTVIADLDGNQIGLFSKKSKP